MKQPKITLLPNLLVPEQDPGSVFVPLVEQVVPKLDGMVGESLKKTRAFLKHFKCHMPHAVLDEHTKDLEFLLEPILEGQHWGLISDCGLPSLADPGESLVALARRKGVCIDAIPGPSSIVQTLLLSGLPAEKFVFHGYIPYKEKPLPNFAKGYTHLFIEAPYRNQQTLMRLLAALRQDDLFCLGVDIGAPTQQVIVEKVKRVKKMDLQIDKRPTVFAFYQGT